MALIQSRKWNQITSKEVARGDPMELFKGGGGLGWGGGLSNKCSEAFFKITIIILSPIIIPRMITARKIFTTFIQKQYLYSFISIIKGGTVV